MAHNRAEQKVSLANNGGKAERRRSRSLTQICIRGPRPESSGGGEGIGGRQLFSRFVSQYRMKKGVIRVSKMDVKKRKAIISQTIRIHGGSLELGFGGARKKEKRVW